MSGKILNCSDCWTADNRITTSSHFYEDFPVCLFHFNERSTLDIHQQEEVDKRFVRIGDEVMLYRAKAPYEPSGESILGALEYDPVADLAKCHECGKWWKSVGAHLKSHGLNSRQYKIKHGLALKSALVSESKREASIRTALSKNLAQYLTPGSKRLAETRTPRPSKRSIEAQNRIRRCSAQLLSDIRNVAAYLGRTPSVRELEENGIAQSTLSYRFGEYKNAIVASGLEPNPQHAHYRYTDDQLLGLMGNFITWHKRSPSWSDFKREKLPTSNTYIARFGSLKKAIAEARKVLSRNAEPRTFEFLNVTTFDKDRGLGTRPG